ncbi:MAG: hypothetical protein ACXWQR_09110 [Ktedonobacterales bacterium]
MDYPKTWVSEFADTLGIWRGEEAGEVHALPLAALHAIWSIEMERPQMRMAIYTGMLATAAEIDGQVAWQGGGVPGHAGALGRITARVPPSVEPVSGCGPVVAGSASWLRRAVAQHSCQAKRQW